MIHITTTHHRNDLENLALLLTIAAGQIDHMTIHLTRQLNYYDGMRTSTAGIATIVGTPRTIKDDDLDQAPPTSVEAAVINRQRILDELEDVTVQIRGMTTMARDLMKMIQRGVATTATKAAPRCTSSGRDGNVEWGDPNCWDMPARGPLCPRCYQRERRWRQAHGLPTRDDTAA
jgi:hypothetical protein